MKMKESMNVQWFMKLLGALGVSAMIGILFTGCGGDPYLKDKYTHILEEKNMLVEERFPLHQEVNALRTGYFELGKDFAETRSAMSQMERQLQETDGRMQTVLSTIEDRSAEEENAKKMMTEVTNRVEQLEQRLGVLIKSTDDILRVVRGHREGPSEVKGIGKKQPLSSIHTQSSSSKKSKKESSVGKSGPEKTEKSLEQSKQSASDQNS
ncbi:MAG: hypothetical protein NPIRA02_01160 [Nitrospirales bacterium]|nr:MAG: hypothetical protein NPIRA02_01160 [Nitrospirales bacterium]